MTAYGVLQFEDMSKVFDVDADMLQRTRTWLRNRADGAGSFKRNPRSLSFGSAPQEIVRCAPLDAVVVALCMTS